MRQSASCRRLTLLNCPGEGIPSLRALPFEPRVRVEARIGSRRLRDPPSAINHG
jgi:hypothetical protein